MLVGCRGVLCRSRQHDQRRTRSSPSEDRVGIDDTFDVRVYGETELSGTFRVATDGTVDYPLAGRMQVAGLRTGEIQQLLVSKLKDKYLKDPRSSSPIKDRNSQKISVLGQVAKPGQVGYYPNMTIVDAIASAGGFTGIAAKNSVNLRREVGGQDRDARLSRRRHQRRTLAKRDGSPR